MLVSMTKDKGPHMTEIQILEGSYSWLMLMSVRESSNSGLTAVSEINYQCQVEEVQLEETQPPSSILCWWIRTRGKAVILVQPHIT